VLPAELDLAELHVIQDRPTGLVAAVAIHDLTLGPARGGTRLRAYPDLQAGVREAARLARAMTWKMAIHGLPFGGGKAVILQDALGRSDAGVLEARLRRYGAFVKRLGDVFGTGPDMGIGPAEARILKDVCAQHVAGADSHAESSRATAAGVRRCLQLALGDDDLSGVRVAVQGVGAVGGALARDLAARGSQLVLADVDRARVESLATELGAELAAPEAALTADVDAVCPCAAGEVLSADVVAALRARVVVGGANDQLVEPQQARARELAGRGILFVPDFVANGGAAVALTGCDQEAGPGAAERAEAQVGETCARVLEQAERQGVTPWEAAIALAQARIEGAR
jgi:leucine dehydrogenase